MKRNKKGSTIIEATYMYPIVILISIGLIYLMVSIYLEAETQSKLHIYTREYAGRLSECSENLIVTEKGTSSAISLEKADYRHAFGKTRLYENNRVIKSDKDYVALEKIINEVEYDKWQDLGLSILK